MGRFFFSFLFSSEGNDISGEEYLHTHGQGLNSDNTRNLIHIIKP